MKHNIQLDCSAEGIAAKAEDFAVVIEKIAAEIGPNDQVVAQVIQGDLTDLLIEVACGTAKEQIAEALVAARAEQDAAFAAVRPKEPVSEPEAQPEPAPESPDAAPEGEPEPDEDKKSRKKK